jgi:hypothetical protein
MIEIGYRVAGNSLYSFDQNGTHAEIGSIPGSGRCIFADDGQNLFVVTDRAVYKYDSISGVIANVTSGNIGSPNGVAYLNDKFIYDRGQGNDFAVSNVGAGETVNIANIAGAISDPDDLLMCYAFRQSMFFYGSRTIETWYDKGTGSPPLDRIDGQIFPVGLAAIYSLSHNDTAMYFLGDDRQIYQFTGAKPTRVSSPSLSNEIEGYSVVSDAIGWCFTIQGQNFYCITFPTESKTWVINETFGKNGWVQISSGIGGQSYGATSYVYVYGKHWLAGEHNGALYSWDLETYQNDGEVMERRRTFPPISGSSLGAAGRRLQMSKIEIKMEKGVGLISGQGDDPQIIVEISTDGHTYMEIGRPKIGRLGDFSLKVEAFALVTFYDLTVRLTVTDPVFCSIHAIDIDIKEAGR